MTIRIAVGGIVHETNTMATTPTGLAEFDENKLLIGEDLRELVGTNTVIGGMVEAIDGDPELRMVPLAFGTAIPGGTR